MEERDLNESKVAELANRIFGTSLQTNKNGVVYSASPDETGHRPSMPAPIVAPDGRIINPREVLKRDGKLDLGARGALESADQIASFTPTKR